MKRSFLVWALVLGAWGILPAISRGVVLSPIGTWEVTILGSDRGTSIMTFSNDLTTVTGCGITRDQSGFFTIAGNWSVNAGGDAIVSYVMSTNGLGSGGVSFTAHLLRSGWFRGSGHDNHGKLLHFKGRQPSSLPDLTGSWTSVVKRHTKTLHETYAITVSTNFPATFDVTGNGLSDTGSFTLSGTIIATPDNKLNASIDRTFGVDTQHSALAGRVKHGDSEMQLKGKDDTNARLVIEATKDIP